MASDTGLEKPTDSTKRRSSSLPWSLLVSMRPRQWPKNAVLLVPLLFSLHLTNRAALWWSFEAVIAFCLLAGGIYLANDLLDRECDRRHPLKRLRPVASGELPPTQAAVAAVLVEIAGLVLASTLGWAFLLCAIGYLALQTSYSLFLKKIAVLDVFAIAGGFVLRVVAGAEAIDVPISNWLYLCTLLLALFLSLEKRRAELVLLSEEAAGHRNILGAYTVELLDQLVAVASGSTVLAYSLYTLSPDTIAKFGNDRLKFTVPFVLFGIFRYLYLVHRRNQGGQPEQVLLEDLPTQLNLFGYLAVTIWAIYFGNS